MSNSSQSFITDKARLTAIASGACTGVSVFLFRGFIGSPPSPIDPAKAHLAILLLLATLSGLAAALAARTQLQTRAQAVGIGARLGIHAGFLCAAVAGGILTIMATLDAGGADSSLLDRVLRARMWLLLSVSMASLLPGVLCGFVGGLIGGRFVAAKWPDTKPVEAAGAIPWLRWAQLGIVSLAVLALASPVSFVGKAPVVDPPPLVIAPPAPPSPPPFRYEPPVGIKSARMGEIQPDFTKVISDVQSSCPVAMSPDGVLIAFGDSAGAGAAVGIFDLHRFSKVASITVPSFPHGIMAWSPDQKSIACTLGEGQSRRIWILRVASGEAIELPRPPGRDVPGGDLFWWQEGELAFFPEDEAPLAFDLQKLALAPFEDSPSYKKLDDTNKKNWIEGPRTSWPEQSGWKLALRTMLRSAVPPSRHQPEAPWQFSGDTVCAYAHPQLPLAFGFKSLGVDDGDKILCSSDGSKLIRLLNGKIEVTFMKKSLCPDLLLEVEMPFSVEEIESTEWRNQIEAKELCLLVYAPLKNPLNNAVVGPNYNQVRSLARLIDWKGRKAIFIVQICDTSIEPEDIASTLHFWEPEKMSEWNPIGTRLWWATIKPASATPPETLSELHSPQLLDLIQEPSSMLVRKAVEKPRAPPQQKLQEATPSPPSSSPTISEQDVKAFLADHHAKASRGDVVAMMSDYDQVVDFLDKGRIPVANIESEEREHRQKWPKGSEQVVGLISATNQSGGWNATYTIAFYNENAAGEWHKGRADLSINIRVEGARLYITSQRAKVYDVTDSKQSSKSSAFEAPPIPPPKGVPISVPRPCFVSVTQAKDNRQIEFTDQISFVNGITWHRTYREMSRDGKALNICRAIYEGSGGVAPDHKSARVYVGSQGWERSLGTPEFVRLCEKSAASMIGKAFNFQFTQAGMVESGLGISFRLQK